MKSLDFEKESVADARPVPERDPVGVGTPELIRRRTPQPKSVLLEATAAWIGTLPETVRPVELARRFPRIANSIAQLWRHVAPCEDYLESLVVDRRGNRTGFPPAVAQEIAILRGYYVELHPVSRPSRDLVATAR